MNAAHVHLVLNHIPIFGLIFGFLFMLVGMIRRNPDVARAGVGVLVLTALATILVFMTGEGAEEVAEHLPGVSDQLIERHEEAGLVTLYAVEILGLLALLGLVRFRRPKVMPLWFLPTLLFLTLGVGFWVGWTSHLGGQIRHSETRADFEAPMIEEAADEH